MKIKIHGYTHATYASHFTFEYSFLKNTIKVVKSRNSNPLSFDLSLLEQYVRGLASPSRTDKIARIQDILRYNEGKCCFIKPSYKRHFTCYLYNANNTDEFMILAPVDITVLLNQMLRV